MYPAFRFSGQILRLSFSNQDSWQNVFFLKTILLLFLFFWNLISVESNLVD